MKEVLNQLADRLESAKASDTPRQTMQRVADELRELSSTIPDDDGLRSEALDMIKMINGHQYGLRGFGDGSISRGRDLTSRERQIITTALGHFGRSVP